MTEIEQVSENLYCLRIPLPENPLKWLNCYIIKGGSGRNLLIDTGFNNDVCQSALFEGMDALRILPADTDVFLSHLHYDHTGNAAALKERGCSIFMGKVDYERFRLGEQNSWAEGRNRVYLEGMPKDVIRSIYSGDNLLRRSSGSVSATELEEGDLIIRGGYELECILTPGHTPGHMCLYDRNTQTMILGDHVLFDITPNICAWPGVPDSLGIYLKSLGKIAKFKVKTALPGHRGWDSTTLPERVAQLLEHHKLRLEDTLRIISDTPGMCGYEIAKRMRWHIWADAWEDFPASQKYFAVSETLSHIDHLVCNGLVSRETGSGGFTGYYLK